MTWFTVTGYLCHKWLLIGSFCCNHNPVLSSFTAYHLDCNNTNTTDAAYGAGPAYPSGAPGFVPFLLPIVLFIIIRLTNSHFHFGYHFSYKVDWFSSILVHVTYCTRLFIIHTCTSCHSTLMFCQYM
jgi:hypothetical protein